MTYLKNQKALTAEDNIDACKNQLQVAFRQLTDFFGE
jgi:hypothetical protein